MSWENFSIEEFACKHCGENKIEKELIDKITKQYKSAFGIHRMN